MSGNSIIIECSEQGKNTFTRNTNGDYSVFIPPVKIEKNDVIELKSAFIDSVSSSSNKCNVPPDVEGGSTASLGFTFGYYAIDHEGTQDTTNNPRTFEDFAGQPVNHPNGKTYILNKKESNDPQTDSKKLIGFKVAFKGGKTGNIGTNRGIYFLLATCITKPTADPVGSPNTFSFQFTFNGKFANIHKYIDADGNMTFTDDIIKDMFNTGFLEEAQPQGATVSLSGFTSAPSVKELFPDSVNSLSPDRGGSIGFGKVQAITIEDFGNNETLSTVFKQQITFDIPAKSYDPHDLAELITDKLTNPLLGGPLPADNFTISTNPILTTARTLLNDGQFGGIAPQFFHPTQGRFTYNTSAAGSDPDYYVGSSEVGLVYDDITDTFKFASLHSSLYSTDPNEKNPSQVVNIVSDGSGGKIALNKSGGIFFTNLTPRNLWIGPESVFKFNSNILVTPGTNSVTVGGVKVNFETTALIDGLNITGDLQGLDSLVQKQTIAPAPTDPNGKGFDIVPTLPYSTAVSQTTSINADNNMSSNREAFFKLEITLPNIRQNVILNHLPEENDQTFGNSTINGNIQAIIGRYYNANNFTSAYNEGSIPYIYNQDEPTILSEVKIRILDPSGTLATGLGEKNTVFLQIQKNNTEI